jgi:apolipoprotein N-acyltransferase
VIGPLARRRLGGGAAMVLAGLLHTQAFAPREAWWLQIAALAWLAWAVRDATPRAAAWRGWCFGLGWLGSGLWWLYISLHDYGELAAPLSAAAVGLLAALLSLYLALALGLFARLRRGRPLGDTALFAACWLLAELARASWFTGFPWIASGYAHTQGPLSALAPWLGVYGIGAVSAWLAAALSWLRRARGPLLLGGGVVLAAAVAPAGFTVPTGHLSVSLLQTNVPQDTKFDPERIADHMQALQRQVLAARGQLVVTPESVLPLPRAALAAGYWDGLTAPFHRDGRAALIGTFLGDDDSGYVNSLVGVGPGSRPDYSYGKRHLLPFGEFVPAGFHWFVALLNIPLGDQARGRSEQPFEIGGQRVRPLICYEDLFGEDFAPALLGPQAPTVLLNVSNLAWFGHSAAQAQHLQFSRMRSLEFQRPMLRAGNTGLTALVDHRGRVLEQLPAWTEGTLDVTVEGRLGDTPYARWLGRLGLWPLWGLAAAALAGLARPRRRPAP